MDVLVFGAGSLGSLVGGLLARTHEVTLVGRDPHVAAVRESGLRVTGAFDLRVAPAARTALGEPGPDPVTERRRENERGRGQERSRDRERESARAFDGAVVTVKAFDTAGAARALAAADVGVAVSLQNGMGNEGVLADGLDAPVLAGTCTYGARLVEPGVVECTGEGTVAVGAPRGGSSDRAERVAAAFREGGLDATAAADMPRRLWEKLAVNAGINPVTALAHVQNGALVDGPAAGTAREAARETARVARAAGVDLGTDETADAVTRVAGATAPNVSSMRGDIESGSRTEVDAINGYVVERAAEHGVSVPVNRTLADLLRAWEREQGLR